MVSYALVLALCVSFASANPVKVTNFLVDTYEFKIFTGGNNDAGTDSEVMFEMFGEQDVDGDFPSSGMVYPRNLGATFDQGAVDEFQFKTSFLGTITRLNIGHDNSGADGTWFLERVEVFDHLSNRCYMFFHQNWIGMNFGGSSFVMIDADTVLPSQCNF